MPVKFWLSDDDYLCVFCAHVSEKGVVVEVGKHRFFACANCMEEIIPRLRFLPRQNESHLCVCCGKTSKEGRISHLEENWFFTCEKCIEKTIPAFLEGWRKFGHKKNKAERIKHIQGQLVSIAMREERREAARNAQNKVSSGAELNRLDIEHLMCQQCKVKIDLKNLICPLCGQRYCQYCGAKMNMESPGKCPRCGGVPNYTQAPLVVTTIDDIPPEDRFWEGLPECPKCKAAVEPDWAECPFCGYKLRKNPS